MNLQIKINQHLIVNICKWTCLDTNNVSIGEKVRGTDSRALVKL